MMFPDGGIVVDMAGGGKAPIAAGAVIVDVGLSGKDNIGGGVGLEADMFML
jgi:hypothetical protein